METYILQILENNNRVIVPEFGAFIVKQRNPLTIVFNEFLQYNDGMLVDFISKTDGISRDDAKVKIETFIKTVNMHIERGDSFTLPGLGIITKSAAGKISIVSAEGVTKPKRKTPKASDTKTAEKAVQEVSEEPVDQDKNEAVTGKEVELEPLPDPAEKEEETEEKVSAEKAEEPKEIKKSPEKEKIPVTLNKEEAPKPAEKKAEVPKQEPEKKVPAPSRSNREYSTETTRPRKAKTRSKTSIIVWVVIIIIVNALLIGYFVYNKELGQLFVKSENETTTEYNQDEMLVPEIGEEATLEELHPEEITEPVQKASPTPAPAKKTVTGTRFYIVAGVFRDEQNADKLVSDLRSQGYNAEKFGRIGSLHAVSYDVFDNRADADKLLREIKQNKDAEAWIRTVK